MRRSAASLKAWFRCLSSSCVSLGVTWFRHCSKVMTRPPVGMTDPPGAVYYPLDRAVEEEFLVPYEVFTHTTQFLREGIKYDQLSDEQKQQIEEDGIDPDELEHEAKTIDQPRLMASI